MKSILPTLRGLALGLALALSIAPAFGGPTKSRPLKIVIDPGYSMTVNGVQHFGAFTELHRESLLGIYRTESFLYAVDHTGLLSILAQLPKKDSHAGLVTLYKAAETPDLQALYAEGAIQNRYQAYVVDVRYPDESVFRQEFLFEIDPADSTSVFIIEPEWLSASMRQGLQEYTLDSDMTWGEGGYKALLLDHIYKSGSTHLPVVIDEPKSKEMNSYKPPHLPLGLKRTPLVSYASAWQDAHAGYIANLNSLHDKLRKDASHFDQGIHLRWDDLDLQADKAKVKKTDHSFVEYLAYLKVRDKITTKQLSRLMQALALTAQGKEVEVESTGRKVWAVILSKWRDGHESSFKVGIFQGLVLHACSIFGDHSRWINDARNL